MGRLFRTSSLGRSFVVALVGALVGFFACALNGAIIDAIVGALLSLYSDNTSFLYNPQYNPVEVYVVTTFYVEVYVVARE